MNYLKTLAALTVTLAFSAELSSAQTIITTLPYTISTPGIYALSHPLAYSSLSGNAISVMASNVTINLNGYGITNTADQTKTTANAIYGSNVENLTIENGEIFGFFRGIFVTGPSSGISFNAGHIVQNLRLAYCTGVGIYLQYVSNCLIQNCLVSIIGTTGGGVQVNSFAFGISVRSLGGGTRVYRNQVFNSTGDGFFALANGSQGAYLEQNLATNCKFGFDFLDTVEAYRDNASFGATTAAFNGGNDFGGNHSQ
jgi:hypothetical protein